MPKVAIPLLASAALSLGGCTFKDRSSATQSTDEAPTLNSASDTDLFRNSNNVAPNLQQELKRQFLAAVGISKILREFAGSKGDLLFTELGISKIEDAKVNIDVTTDGKVEMKKAAASSSGEAAESNPLGINVNATYAVTTSTYNISLAFQDKSTDEVFRFHLSRPLEVQDNLKITSRVKISFSAIKALPPQLGAIVARFLGDISLSVDSGVAWERSSELSTRMYYRAKQNGATELMRDFTGEVIRPLCLTFAQRRGKPSSVCDVELAPTDDPVAELAKPRVIQGCEKTALIESLFPVYKLYVPIPKGTQIYRDGEKAYLFESMLGGWKRAGWVTIVGETDRARCPGISADTTCVVAKYGQHWFDNRCKSAYEQPGYAISPDPDAESILN